MPQRPRVPCHIILDFASDVLYDKNTNDICSDFVYGFLYGWREADFDFVLEYITKHCVNAKIR